MMNEVEVGGHRVAYRRAGSGPPIVLLHGWSTNSREWQRHVDGLSDEFTVVAWDAPGAGRSSDPPPSFRLPDWADCLAAFIDALGLGRPHVVGLSWGGGLALELHRRHPTVARTLVLVSAYAGWAGSLAADVVADRLALMLRNTDLPFEEWPESYLRTLVAPDATPAVVDEVRSIVAEFHPEATKAAMRAFAEADLRDVLPRVDVPTLLLYGEHDVRAPRSVWEPLHAAMPGSELVLVPGVGHMIDLEAPARFDAEVRAFVRRCEATPS